MIFSPPLPSVISFLAIAVSFLFLWLYIVLASVELGSSLFILFPGLLGGETGNDESGTTITGITGKLINPIWETTNVFLVGFIVSLIAFFPGVLPWISQALFAALSLFLIVTGIRFVLMLIFFYAPSSDLGGALQNSLLIRMLFVLASFAGPLILAWAALYAFIGTAPGSSFLLLVLFVATAASLCTFAAVGFLLAGWRGKTWPKILTQFTDISCVIYAAALITFFKILPFSVPHTLFDPMLLSKLFWSAIASISAFLIVLLGRLARQITLFFIGLGLAAGVAVYSLVFLQLPYLAYPSVLAADAFTNPSVAQVLLVVWCVGLLILVPSFVLLYKLFIFTSAE